MEKIGKSFEVVRKFIENTDPREIALCIKSLEGRAEQIGWGKNADILAVGDKSYRKLCAKKIKDKPLVLDNRPEEEFKYQQKVRALGIKTPASIAIVRNIDTGEEYLIMERIMGPSIGDVVSSEVNAPIPEKYNHDVFFKKLKDNLKKMHDEGIYHRDLHSGNVMIDEEGDPVIIDFGSATEAFSGDEEKYVQTQVKHYDQVNNRYNVVSGRYLEDEMGYESLRSAMNRHINPQVIRIDKPWEL
ncbi:MAG: phosphotransferase [Candidatus Paceibacterota bacterium]